MARVKGGMKTRARKKKLFKSTKGYWGGNKNRYRHAMETSARAGAFAFRDRKQKKREYRNLWIARINAAARLNGISYSRLMAGLKLAKVEVDRKMLAELAVSDATAFASLVEAAKKALPLAAQKLVAAKAAPKAA
jgi:large subunit ribosomal protein L20